MEDEALSQHSLYATIPVLHISHYANVFKQSWRIDVDLLL